ncbi:MAG: heme-binding protein [Pseudomonadales bacterium]
MKKTHIALIALILTGNGEAMAYEEPAFTVVATIDGVEFRHYEPYLVAETTVVEENDRGKAVNIGFRRLFNYISGDNVLRTEVEAADPDSAGTKIAMTVPVQQSRQAEGWTVSFVVPLEFQAGDVPLPIDSRVHIRQVPDKLMAVIRYSGRWSDDNVAHHQAELLVRLRALDVEPAGPMMTAYYNSPFSLPFMRRNEVMIPVDPSSVNRPQS